MTIQSHEKQVIFPAEKCLFPIRNDGNSPEDAPEKRWGVTKLSSCTLRKAGILSSCSCSSCENQTNGVEQKDPLYFLAVVWALLLWEFAEVDTVQIGVHDILSSQAGRMKKQHMRLLASSRSQTKTINELLTGKGWSVSNVSESHYPYFNTGIALYHSQGEKNVAVLDCLDRTRTAQEFITEGEQEEEVCDMTLVLNLDQSECFLVYKTTVLSGGQAEHLISFLEEAVATVASKDTTCSPSQLEINSIAQNNLIRGWNSQTLIQPSAQTIHQIIHSISVAQPSHLALVADDGELTYAELDAASSRLASHLQTLGVRPGMLIPVCFNKTLWAIVAMLAINKAGAAFVPLDAAQPLSRLRLIVNQLNGPPIGLASPTNQALLNEVITPTLVVSESTVSEILENVRLSDWQIDATGPSYCFFTSGSTGEPKGCLVDHAALASVATHCHALHLNSTSRVLQFASFSFGVSLIEIWCTLAASGTLCMPSDSDRVSRLGDAIRAMAINWAFVTPTVLSTIHPDAVPGLHRILVAGEPLKKAQISLWSERTHLFQAYGFTEWAGVCCVSPQIHSIADIGIIGTAANARCWLIEPGNPDRLAPIGAVGELLVEGPSLAQGYLHSPEKSAASFLEAPSWRRQGSPGALGRENGEAERNSQCYKTGDLAYYDSNGLLRYVSRKDRQVKVHGQRIDLGEPEFHVAQASDLFRKAAIDAIVPSAGDGVAILVTFVPASSESQASNNRADQKAAGNDSFFILPDEEFVATAQLAIKALGHKLPDVMIPRIFVQIKSMPLTVTGKIDRRRLREEAEKLQHDELLRWAGAVITSVAADTPSTPHECLIHRLVVEVLNLRLEQVGMEHDFFALGGDSVKAMKLVSQARAAGIELTVVHIFKASQLRELASSTVDLAQSPPVELPNSKPFDLLDAPLKSVLMSAATTQCRVEESQVEDIYPCTSLQEGMMALSAARPGAYVARFIHRLQPHVDPTRLRRAWEVVVNASPILRTRIVSAPNDGMFQVVLRESFQWDDTTPGAEVDSYAYITKRQREPLLLGRPLVHAALLKGSASSNNIGSDPLSTYFIVTMHHSVCDRWAGGLLLGLLEKAYSGQTLMPNSMTPLIHYLQQNLGNPSTKEYWKSQFKDLQAEIFPSLPSPGYTPVATESCHLSISRQRNVPSGYTISNVLRLAWAMVISHYTSSPDVVFGITVSGRSAPVVGIEQMIAPIVATVPLRVRLNPNDTVLDALSAIQNQFTEMIPFEQYGLQQIRKVSSDGADGCSFQSHLVVQPSWGDENNPLLTTLEAGPAIEGGFASSALLVACNLTASQQVNVTMEFDPSVIPILGVEHIMSHFEQSVQCLLADPLCPLADLPLISPMDMQRLSQWNANLTGGEERCVHEIIKQRCRENPASTAIWAWDGKLTYAELDRISDRLAAELIVGHGVEAELIVPICMDKSFWATVAIVGVMKAGGAFVLLDPSQPQQGLESICRRTDARIILTSQGNTELAYKLASNVLVIDQDNSDSWPASACKPTVPVNPKSTLYVAFTSGSTGTPKGAVTEHHSICFSIPAFNTAAQVTPQSRVLQFSSYSFDCSILETLGALMAGACLCVPSEFQRRNELVSATKEFSLTHAYLTPSLARHVMPSDPDFTKILVSVGEPLMPSDMAGWASNNPKYRVMNAYGPAECAIVTTVQTDITAHSKPQNLGFPLASICCWVVHPESHEILLPIGAVGELVVEGPTVGRGYLNDPAQSSAVYISSPPSWMKTIRPGGTHGRLYKTGDLVRYHSNGSLEFVGRRDSQVKLRGQRIELGGVEKHVRKCWPEIDDVAVEMVTFVTTSSSTQTLVAFVVTSLSDEEGVAATNGDSDILLLTNPNPTFREQGAAAYALLNDKIPRFMVPEIYLPLRALPQSASGKLDRRRLNNLAKGCSQEQLALYRGDSVARQKRTPSSEAEHLMQAMWASVLNQPLEEIGVDDNFYHLGGDSITAMQIVAHARTKGLSVSVNEIMRYKTISQVLLHAVPSTVVRRRHGKATTGEEVQEELDVFFPLSPIQQMFMDKQQLEGSWNRFNQTFLLRLTQTISLVQLQEAINTLLSRHSMLRARFSRLPDDGQWGQNVGAAATIEEQSCHCICSAHKLRSRAELGKVMAASSQSIDIEKGPLSVADLIDVTEDNSQHLFLAIHHLVVDLVSWRIILSELEAMLRGKTLPKLDDSISFQTWSRLQAQYAKQSLGPKVALPLNLPDNYYEDPGAFWLTSPELPNCMADTQFQTFTLDEKTTRQLLGVANAAFNTQPVEILHAALLHSFLQVFPNRAMPLAFSESHGRETWDPTIDLAETVGWFTTVWPVVVAEMEQNDRHDPLEVIRRVKDARRAVPSKGWAYFASRYLNPAGRQAFQQRHPIELIFNYSGEYQQLEHADALFVAESHQAQGALDAGGDIQRFGIFEVFASVQRSCLQFQFMYPRKIHHQDAVDKWIKTCQRTLGVISSQLLIANQREIHTSYTLSDFPLMPSLTYPQLQELVHTTLPALGISIDNVEDIYPCSPSQRGMLIAQAKQAHSYNTSVTWKIQFRNNKPGQTLDLHLLHAACCQVIERHAGLRTVFVDSPSPDSYMDQIVLKNVKPEAAIKQLSESEFNPLLATQSGRWPKGQLMHQINLCKVEDGEDGEVLLRLDISHTIMDRTTMQIIERDLCLAYEGKLPPGPGPLYSDYISHIYQQDIEADSLYWKQYLEGVEPCQFPSINDDGGISGEEWGVVSRILYQSSLGKTTIDNFCRNHNVTVWNLAGLAWALVLRSFTNSDNVCFGYVKSGRDLPIDGIEDAVGAILNPLACRVSLDSGSTVQDTVHQLQEEYLQSLQHQSFPLSDAHRLAGVTNEMLFNTYVGVQSGHIDNEEERALEFTIVDLKDEAEFDVLVSITPGPNVVALNIRYKTYVLSHPKATTVIATFEKAIRSIVTAGSETIITDVDIFSEHDQEIIWARNQTPSAPVESCVHEIIQQRCIEYPDSEAVCDTDGSFTYRELDELSSRLARYLTVECGGVASNEVVPICLERSRWTPIAMLGVLKAGGTFLLLDTSYPHQRRVETCNKVDARIAVISSTHAETDRELASIVVLVGSNDCSWDTREHHKDKTLLPKVQPDHALYVVFTSGSTGNPKGLVVDHRSYCTGARDHIAAWKLTRESRVTQFASYAFDMCVLEQLSVLTAGACICIVSDEQRNNLGEVASALKANFAMLVPSVARLFRPEDLPSIDTLMLAGECMTKTDVSSWAHHVRLLNGYGPSECSPLSAVQSTIYATSDPRNVGLPIGCVFWVVDAHDHNKLVPHGAIGELVIEGPIVGLGYINQPDQTAKVFIEPTAWLRSLRPQQRAGTHLYKTGDLVRTNSDGSLIIIGRKDRQVKVRGQRLELADVEAHVHRCFQGAALDAVVEMVAPAGTTKSQLVGLVLCQEQTENGEEEHPVSGRNDILKAPSKSFAAQVAAVVIKLRQTVPDFMVPTIFLPLLQMPRTYSGKVDRNRLRNLVGSMSLEELQVYRALSSSPSSAIVTNGDRLSTNKERILGGIWAQVLELSLDTISIHDNLFLRGGHSIDAMKVAALSRAAGMTLSVVDIFAHPILTDLAKATVQRTGTTSTDEGEDKSSQPFSLSPIDNPTALHARLCAEGIIPSNSTLEDLLPATQSQDLFIQRETFHSYNWTIRDSSMDIGRIRAACQSLVDRYSILRTCFVGHEGRPLQMILGNFDAEILEFTCSQDEDPLDFSEALWDKTDSPRIDGLGASLPFRFTLVSRPWQQHIVLTFQISHAQWDGISIHRLFSDFASIFNQTPLPPTSDFSQYSYQRALPPQIQKENHPDFQFWREYLDSAEMAVPFPPPGQTLHEEPAAAEQPDESLWTVKGISPPPQLPAGVTMATLVKSASAFFLSHHLRRRDLVFGHTTNGRNLAMNNIESMLGCCLNFIPLRITFPESPAAWTVRDLMSHVQNQYIRALPHEHVELREILEHSTDWPAETPLNFIVQHQNIDFSYNLPLRRTVGVANGEMDAGEGGGSNDDLLDVEFSRFARFKSLDEIWVFTEPHPDRLEVQICGNSRVLSQEKATDMSDKICGIIETFAANPDMKLEDIVL
ncbi:hypothetical protein V492_06294 [Pseudogymnoascus sp. VKM F-4246]|nr:hypothetical protein V492_06294 [Pseudogymnoascus sp. VKM F-4246]